MSCSGVCVRWTTFIVGCFIWLGGSLMLGIGIWVKTQDTEYKHLSINLNITIGYIVISSFIFSLGFIGVYSILLLKRKLLMLYFILLLMLLLAEMAIAIYIYVQQDKAEEYIKKSWNEMDDEARIWIQNKLHCCSMHPVILSHTSSYDKSCFKDKNTTEERLEDCYASLVNWMKTNLQMLIIFAAVVGAFEIFAMAGVLRIITFIESNNHMIRQVTVAPYYGKPPHVSKRTWQTRGDQEMPSEVSSRSEAMQQTDEVPEEVFLETRRNSLECWAKHLPKYNHSL